MYTSLGSKTEESMILMQFKKSFKIELRKIEFPIQTRIQKPGKKMYHMQSRHSFLKKRLGLEMGNAHIKIFSTVTFSG